MRAISGAVFSWGRNFEGQCGHSTNNAINLDESELGLSLDASSHCYGPQRIDFEQADLVTSIECGDLTSAFVTYSGQLFTFGDNSEG